MERNHVNRWKRELAMATAVTLALGNAPVSVLAAEDTIPVVMQSVIEEITKKTVADIDNPLLWYKFGGEVTSFASSNGDAVQISDKEFKNKPDYSISAWINWNGTLSGSNTILRSDDGLFCFHIRKQDGNDRKLWVDYPDGNVNSGDVLVPENEWVHVALVNDSVSGTKLYMNGELVGESNTPAKWKADSNGFMISREAWHVFNGAIDDVRIYDGILTGEQISIMYRNLLTK